MKAVSQFVALRSDEGGLHAVHSPIHRILIHIAELLREKLPQLWHDGMNERPASSDNILVEATLALMHSHGNTAGQSRKVKAVIASQLIQGMSSFMNHGIHGADGIVLIIMGGNPNILVAEIGGKRMLRLCNAAICPVQAHDIHQIV